MPSLHNIQLGGQCLIMPAILSYELLFYWVEKTTVSLTLCNMKYENLEGRSIYFSNYNAAVSRLVSYSSKLK